MPFIAREDGEHFVIPSYRDVLATKQKSALKKEIILLSKSYGDFIALQRKGANQYEVAFSTDIGYLLGESVWQYFKRPMDMIYCEAVPNTTEVILVIVKSGSVYLDGSFPAENVPEELVIFLTQQNSFEIYVSGDVPISQQPERGKFSFDAKSVKSFVVLEKPIFQTLPLLKMYQLQPVDVQLQSYGIGVFPTKQLIVVVGFIVVVWIGYDFLSSKKTVVQTIPFYQSDPYQNFNLALMSPVPNQEVNGFLSVFKRLMTIPGWGPQKIDYTKGTVTAVVKSSGGNMANLLEWTKSHNFQVNLLPDGVSVTTKIYFAKRQKPQYIYPITQVLANFVDNLKSIYPGNHIKLGPIMSKQVYSEASFSIDFSEVSPFVLSLIGEQLADLPCVLQSMSVTVSNGNLSGTMMVQALGN